MEKILNYRKKPAVRVKNNSVTDQFLSTVPTELNIYQRAHLTRMDIAEAKSNFLMDNSAGDLKIVFGITGELKGFVICKTNLNKFQQNEKKIGFIQGLFVESMNILLGKILSNIENSYGLMSHLSAPKILTNASNQPILFEELKMLESEVIPLQCNYSLKVDQEIVDCSLFFELLESAIIEV